MTNRQLSENEMWDDSALVQSWNEALEEYKVNHTGFCISQSRAYYIFFQKYHSMSARGERVEDVLDSLEKEEGAQCVVIHICTI